MVTNLPNFRQCFILGVFLISCSACTGLEVGAGTAAVMYVTKPSDPPPADVADQIPAHEDWCYQTMGYAECYSQPQNVDPDRLINVDPQSHYPLTRRAYHEDVIEAQ